MKQEDNIEKLFQEAFENFEVTPPVSVKQGIDKQLNSKKIKPRWIFWWATIILLFLGGVVFAVINSGFFHASSGPAITASDRHVTTSDLESKTTAVNSDDLLSEKGNSENNPSESAALLKSKNTEKEKNAPKNGAESSDAVSEKSKTSQTKSLTSRPKKNTTFSVKKGSNEDMNGSAPRKSRRSYSKQQNTVNGKKGASENSALKSKKGVKKKTKKATFAGGKQQAGSNNEGVNHSNSQGEIAVKPDTEKKIPEYEEKQPEIVPEVKSGKDPVTEKKPEPADSAAMVPASDSTDKIDTETPENPSKDNSKARNWMVEIYGGPRFDSKTSKTDFALKSANSYQIGVGFSRSLNLGPLKYVTLDGEYGGGKESYRQTTTSSTVYLAGIDSIPYFDTITDTIPAGYTYYNDYDTIDQTNETNNNAQITRFAFGLRTQFNFNLGSGFGVAVSPGYYYSRSTYKFSDSSSGTSSSSSSSSQILLNVSVYYDWNRFRFRVGLDSRYELMGKNQSIYFDRRKSMLFTPQFGVAVKF